MESITNVYFLVTNWQFTPTTSHEVQQTLLSLIKPFLPPYILYSKSWRKPSYQINLPEELPKLTKRIDVMNADGITVYDSKQNKSESKIHQAVITLFTILTRLVEGEEKSDKVYAKMTEILCNTELSLTEALGIFFTNKVLQQCDMEIECRTIRLIKGALPHVLQPAEEDLTLHLKDFPYQRVEDTWNTTILFRDDGVTLYHMCKEQSASEDPQKYFTFDWDITFSFDSLQLDELKVVDMGIVTLSFHELTSKQRKYEMQSVFANLAQSASAFRSEMTSLPVTQVLRMVIQTLHKTDPIYIKDSAKFEQTDVVTLLEHVERALRKCDGSLPMVVVPHKNKS